MNAESWVAAVLSFAVLVYLIFTLLRPEKF